MNTLDNRIKISKEEWDELAAWYLRVYQGSDWDPIMIADRVNIISPSGIIVGYKQVSDFYFDEELILCHRQNIEFLAKRKADRDAVALDKVK